jgi:hypothetical protein
MQQPEPKGLIHGGELSGFVKEAAGPLHLGNRQTAAFLVAKYLGLPGPIKSDEQANVIMTVFLQFLLDQQRYVDAATLLWAPTLFSGEPRSVKMIWEALFTNVAVMIPGAASMGKSYSLGVWMMLDWARDPSHTNIQVVGPSETHLERNLFSHLVKLHRAAAIPLPGEIRQLEITVDPKNKDSGILGVVVPVGKKSAIRLQGVKVVARPTPHPQFGALSRLRVILEEAEAIPVGVWDDVTNIIGNAGGSLDRFKIAAPFNPKDPNSQCAVRCEPIGGWGTIDCETSETWVSKRGWKVTRLDAYKSENVLEDTERFMGLQTKQGLDRLIMNAGGVGTPGYYTMARGWYPPQGIDLAVIPQHLVQDIFGTFEFVETPRPAAGVDVALQGGDNAVFMLGKTGLASGWRKQGPDGKDLLVRFVDSFGNPVTKEAIQVEQVYTLPKGDTLKLMAEIKRVALGAHVKADYLAVDRAGNGAGVHDLLVAQPGFSATRGINASESPTEKKILVEDLKTPYDEYSQLISELWFATKKFIEFGFLKISPNIPSDPLIAELTGRQFKLAAGKTRVEPKADYKSRGNKSPDRADALTMLVHAVRMMSNGPVSISGTSGGFDDGPPLEHRVGCTDRMDRL